MVCGGDTGHAEAVRVVYDPQVLSFKDLIRSYLKSFRPRRRQGEETSQYRAAIFYDNPEQKREAIEVLEEFRFDQHERELLLEPAKTFYSAEEYHQKYYEKMSLGASRL